ncbi:hypothetical protein [Halalkalibacter urbisdiaboli]|uniref:hypothetical protein n=1 Tax=Halalkalibacter urbisdiaboli TaxID=1960589 RepID=UPI000B449A48|nr:hypothetical protein [Halalkalibacter urbisdiaboli]
MSEQHHNEVGRIVSEIQPFLAGYLIKQVSACEDGEISAQELINQCTFIERKIDGAVSALFKVRFPRVKQRRNLSVLRQSFLEYKKAAGEVKTALEKGENRMTQIVRNLEKASKLANKYAELTFKDRMKHG